MDTGDLTRSSSQVVRTKGFGGATEELPELGLGTWQYQGGIEPLRLGIGLGATFIDTAESYGTEPVVGKAIRGIRSRVFVASKVSPRHFRYGDVISAAECSLKQLKTDYLDLYQLHWPNYVVPVSETMAAMERLVEMGKIRFIGVSNFTLSELRQAQNQLSSNRIVSNQVGYSLIDRTPEDAVLPYCAENQITLLAYSPLATDLDSLRRADPWDCLGQIGASLGKTRAQVALNWCVSRPPVVAIFKAAKAEHVRENCAASGWSLSSEQHRLLSEHVAAHRTRNWAERLARRSVRRLLQLAGRNLGAPTALDYQRSIGGEHEHRG